MSACDSTTVVLPMVGTFPLVAEDTERDLREGRPQHRNISRVKSFGETMTAVTADPVSVLLHEDDDGDIDEQIQQLSNE